MDIKLPRILSPNLGCPIIVSPDDLMEHGVDVVIAEPINGARSDYGIIAQPSGEGRKFQLILENRQELADPELPDTFAEVEQTRWHISTTLRASIFAGQARFVRFVAKPRSALTGQEQRQVSGQPRITLYDLVLKRGTDNLCTVFHALALRPPADEVHFIHATDPHVSLRNDIYETALGVGEKEAGAGKPPPFVNFNHNLRRFIYQANELADKGELDFVLLLGDLVDFMKHNYSDRDDYGENNWRLFCDILTGAGAKGGRRPKGLGIKVPVFTSTGNHDWRFYPYPPTVNAAAFGLKKKAAKALDPFWADDPEELTKQTKGFYQKMISEGSLLSNIMLGGKYLHKVGDVLRNLRDWKFPRPAGKVRGNLLDWLLPRMATWQVQVLAPLIASGVAAGSTTSWTSRSPVELVTMAFAAVSGLMNGAIGFVKFLVRWRSPDLMGLEAGWQGLQDYFLNLNPYFNYAFRVGKNYFLIMDTGYDCLRAQRFWDDGRKKLSRISIKDNILGGSPDSMGFFGANEFYAYDQIAWMEKLLRHISQRESSDVSPAHIFVGVHAPPVNLSEQERRKADEALRTQPEVLLEEGEYNIRYGSINHYLSQFLHLCLGRAEGRPEEKFRKVTMVFAGHAHWRLECSLRLDDPQTDEPKTLIYYGNYTGPPGTLPGKHWPLILQTPAIGPVGIDEFSKNPPHFRRIEIDKSGAVVQAKVNP